MRHPFIQLLTKACFSVSLLASAQAANAVTITYTTKSATYFPVPNVTDNTRPLQLSPGGTAMTVPARNFIYQKLVGDYAPAGDWQPIFQSTGLFGEQRFDYSFPNATLVNPGPPQVNDWINNLSLTFGSFYLNGTCTFCGSTNAVSVISLTLTGNAKYIGESPTSTAGNQNKLTSGICNILFGASGITGTLKYTAFTDVTLNPFNQESGGTIIINVDVPSPPDPPIPPTTAVPGPLPVLGAGAAFGYSRCLRRRILGKANRNQNTLSNPNQI